MKEPGYKAFFDKVNTVFMILAGAIIIVDALALSIDVLIRYFFRHSWAGLFELTEYSLVWMAFLGAAWLLRKNGHIRMDLVPSLLKERRRALLNTVSLTVCVFPLAVIIWYTAGLTLHDYLTDFTFTSVMELHKWPFEIIMPIGSLVLLAQVILKIQENLANWKALGRRNTAGGADS